MIVATLSHDSQSKKIGWFCTDTAEKVSAHFMHVGAYSDTFSSQYKLLRMSFNT